MLKIENAFFWAIYLITIRIPVKSDENCPSGSFRLKCYDQESDDISIPNKQISKHKISTAARWEVLKNVDCKINISTKFNILGSSSTPANPSKVTRGYGFFDKIGKGVFQVEVYNDHDHLLESLKCQAMTVPEDPIPKILGGSDRILEAEKYAQCDGSQSIDKNNPLKKSQSLSFQWDCKLEAEVAAAKSFCQSGMTDSKYQEPVLKIPPQFAADGAVFHITLKVKSTLDSKGTEVSANQRISFLSGVADLNIECIKNCPIVNPSQPMMLKVNCERNCHDISYKWSILLSQNRKLDIGSYTEKFTVPENKLNRGNSYIFRVETTGVESPKGVVEREFKIPNPPVLKFCRIEPREGKAYFTQFKPYCDWYPPSRDEKLTAEIYSVNKDDRTIMTTLSQENGKDLDSAVFMLPVSTGVEVVIKDAHGGESSKHVPVIVTEETKNHADKNSTIREILEGAENETDPEKILQSLTVFLKESQDLPPQDIIEQAMQALNLLERVIDSKSITNEQLIRATEIIEELSRQFVEEPNPDMSSTATDACRKAAEHILDRLTDSNQQEEYRANAEKNAGTLANCSSLGLKNNSEIIQQKNITDIYSALNITSNSSDISNKDTPQRTENYPDYMDDDNSSDALAKFEKASANMIKLCFLNAKTLAMTLIPEEDAIRTEVVDLVVVAKRKYGKDLAGTSLAGKNVTVTHSNDFLGAPGKVFDVLMCVMDRNPLWWAKEKIASQVVIIQYQERLPLKSKRTLKNALHIREKREKLGDITKYEEDSGHIEAEIKTHEAKLPEKSINDLNENSFYETVSVHRICVHARQNFKITFQNVADDDYFNVLVTNFQKASYEQFKTHSIKISKDDPSLDQTHEFPYDSFYFLSVLPSQRMKKNQGRYFFSVHTLACFLWDEKNKKWQFACKAIPKSNISNLECLCNIGGGTLAGYSRNNKINFVKNQIVTFKLPLTICYTIFSATLIIFGLYCISLCFAEFETRIDILDRVYFLSDVPSYFKYAYLMIIRTGKLKNAGTTSNVSMKLHGEKADSLEHVVNYPDAEGKILAKNQEDWFVIGVENHLGDLKSIEFWFDSVGESPSWYCETVEIYDTQKEMFYYFRIFDWLNISSDNKTSYTVMRTKEAEFFGKEQRNVEERTKSENKQKIAKILTFLRIVVHSRGNHMWNNWKKDDILMKKEKLTLITALILTFFTIQMFLFNCPNFNNSDSIDPNNIGPDYQLIWIPLVGCMITFICHFPIIYVIKRRNAMIAINKNQNNIDKLHGSWILVFFNMSTCITFLIIFGFWIPWNTSSLWLISVILSLIFYGLVLENISCLIYGNILKIYVYVETFTEKVNRSLKFIELQRTWIYKRFGSFALRPYFTHLYGKLDDFTIKDRKSWEAVKSNILEILEDLVMIGIYVALLYTIILIDKEEYAVNSNLQVRSLAQGWRFRDKIAIDHVNSLDSLKKYLINHIVPNFQEQDLPGTTKDLTNHYLGVIRLRQHRTSLALTFEPCCYPEKMHFLNMTCRQNFLISPEKRDFGESWRQDHLNITSAKRLGNSWLYTKAKEAGTSPYLGKIALYPGGGYIAHLGRTPKNSLINLNYLFEKKWFDLLTRAVFVECLLYNPNSNIFNAVQWIFEISATGYVSKKIEIQTRKFLFLRSEVDVLKRVVYISFLVVTAILIIKIIVRILKKRKIILKDVWSLVDLVIIILSCGVVYTYVYRAKQVTIYLEDLSNAQYNKFVNYFHLFAADNLLYSFAASLVFIATLRLWKLMRFLLMIKIVERTLKNSAKPLATLFLYQGIYTVGFGACGMMVFGEASDNFKSVEDTITTLLLLSVNLMEKEDVQIIEMSGAIGEIFYSLYMVFSLFTVTLYIAIVTVYYMEANEFYANERGEFQKYLKLKIGYYYMLLKVKFRNLRGGEENDQNKLIPPKDDQYRYARCLTTSETRIKSMALVTKCLLRNVHKSEKMLLNESDFELMRQTASSLSRKQAAENEMFFISSAKNAKVGLVDDKRLLKIDAILEKLVHHKLACKGQGKKTLFDERVERIEAMIKNLEALIRLMENVSVSSS